MIRVLSLGAVPSASARSVAIQRASEIAKAGQAHAARIGVTIEEADQTIEDAIAAVRHERQLPDHVTFLLWSDSGDGRLADPFSTG